MNIQQFAEATGLTAHTLRYYEKIGLLPHIQRKTSGHRDYSHQDLNWIEFVKRLKATGMPLVEIQHYAQLRQQGDSTMQQRMVLLQRHAELLQQRINEETEHLRNLHQKILFYREQMD